jgi:hypothetical protein
MSVVIVFPSGTDWFKANWVFRQLAQDVSSRYRNDAGICKPLELAQAVGSLDLKGMDVELRSKVMEAIRTVAAETISGAIDGWRPHDQKEHEMYCEALSELAKLIEHQRSTPS